MVFPERVDVLKGKKPFVVMIQQNLGCVLFVDDETKRLFPHDRAGYRLISASRHATATCFNQVVPRFTRASRANSMSPNLQILRNIKLYS